MHVPWLARLKNTRQLRPTCKCSPRPKSPRPAVPRKNRHHPGPVLPRTRRRPASALPRSQVTRISFISCPRWVRNRHNYVASILRLRSPESKIAKWKERSGPYSSRKEAARALIIRASELAPDREFGRHLPELETGRIPGAPSGLWQITITEI